MESSPTPEEILQAVRKTGYLLEQEVATELQNLGFNVQTGRAYQDPEEGKSREIDVLASKVIHHDPENRVAVVAEMLCECKNPQAPFVFIARPLSSADKKRAPLEYDFPYKEVWKRSTEDLSIDIMPAFTYFGFAEHHYFFQTGLKAVQIVRMHQQNKEWRADNAGAFDSIVYPLAKAVTARKAETNRDQNLALEPHNTAYIWLRFPMALISSTFFLIDTTEATPKPQEITHVTLTREIMTEHTKGTFMIDFVTLDGLLPYIKDMVLPFANTVSERVKSSPNDFRSRDPDPSLSKSSRRRRK